MAHILLMEIEKNDKNAVNHRMTPLAMFDVSLGECALALLTALALIKPEELPAALKAVRSGLRKLRDWRDAAAAEVRAFTEGAEDALPPLRMTSEERDAMAAHERYEGVDVGAMDVSRRERGLPVQEVAHSPLEAEGMLDADARATMERMKTASDKIRYLAGRGLTPRDVAAILGKRPTYVYGVLRRDKMKPKK
ncbi:MAG: hypothetical protein ABW189_03610 [Rickettsiales bacterium]